MQPNLRIIFSHLSNSLEIIDRTGRRSPKRRRQKERNKPISFRRLDCLPHPLPTQPPTSAFRGDSPKLYPGYHRCLLRARMRLIRAEGQEFSAGGIGVGRGEGGKVPIAGGDDDDCHGFGGGALDYAAAVACGEENVGESEGCG